MLSREWGNGLWGLLLGIIYVGATIGIHSPVPYEEPDRGSGLWALGALRSCEVSGLRVRGSVQGLGFRAVWGVLPGILAPET